MTVEDYQLKQNNINRNKNKKRFSEPFVSGEIMSKQMSISSEDFSAILTVSDLDISSVMGDDAFFDHSVQTLESEMHFSKNFIIERRKDRKHRRATTEKVPEKNLGGKKMGNQQLFTNDSNIKSICIQLNAENIQSLKNGRKSWTSAKKNNLSINVGNIDCIFK